MIFNCPFCNNFLQESSPTLRGKMTKDFCCNHVNLNSQFAISFHNPKGNIVHFKYQFRTENYIHISLYANQWDSYLYIGTTQPSISLDDYNWFDWDWSNEENLKNQINLLLTFS